jgi:hypothetical protein
MKTAPLVAVAWVCAAALLAAQAPPAVPAPDVKVVARVNSQVAGIIGAMDAMGNPGGEADFVTITTRGQWLAISRRRGADAASAPLSRTEIIDFSAQVTNVVDHAARAYTPMSFADLTKHAAAEHRIGIGLKEGGEFFGPASGIDLPVQTRARANRFDYIAETQETGQVRSIAGIDARQILVSVRAWDHTKAFDDNGGWVVTTDAWVGPSTPAIDRLVARQREYARTINTGVYDAVFTSVEMPNAGGLDPMFPELMPVAAKVLAEIGKLDGTVLASRTTYALARSAKEMVSALHAHQAMERAAGKPVTTDASSVIPRRERIATIVFEYLAIDYAVTNLDVEIPDGFVRKKK